MDKILFVDVCHTIVPHNTTILFLEQYYIKNNFLKKIRRMILVKIINKIIFKLFKKDILRNLYISTLKNRNISSVMSDAKEFAENIDYNQKVLDVVNKYKTQGYQIILLSASIEPVVTAICHYLSYDNSFSSKLNILNGKYTTGIYLDLLDVKNKIIKNKYKNKHLVMISDNFGDSKCIPYLDEYIPVILNNKSKLFWEQFNLKNSIDLRQ
ncbi:MULTISPECIES: haloacid dehalogenase-like hydrolase [Enterobacterales]|nr:MULTISPECIES: haloacid dehalogenase-like hydrolase [Enterobacterales]WOO49895.1 haloacid dehalogenase-like hydrolase [Hafnia alvei]ELB1101889.1 haloacid dehalogenase-like hydrolase [Proteus mirabilis]ELB1103781.1 haloacid dehalogenase-like hydrolase [Proteus mirabilis]MCT0087486.1 haloacid dehalogenase-like hydrolase [Proteus mirabilis]MDL2103366.1 haloacid dehalogenase-like hydrolase [Proteus mirabilis]